MSAIRSASGDSDAKVISSGSGVFPSFWMGGFEGADHINGEGVALDMAGASGHIDHLDADYQRAAAMGVRCVRESVGWRLTETRPGSFDLGRVTRIAATARRHGLQVIWTFMHYGAPADVSLLDDRFCGRFARFATAVARQVGPFAIGAPVYNLINEVSFLSWAVSATNLIAPYRNDPGNPERDGSVDGYDVKCRLVRATLAATAEILAFDPRARFLQIEPIAHVVAPRDRPDLALEAEAVEAYQWQAFDMLAGRTAPELGGHPAALDLVGVNHYHDGQRELMTGAPLHWHGRDARRRPFADMLGEAWRRYGRPLIVGETSHFGEGRALWFHEMADEVARARRDGVPVEGLCLYPLVDRPDWNDASRWHHSGLWDVEPVSRRRILSSTYANALEQWQQVLPSPLLQGKTMKCLILFSHLRWGFVYQRPQHLMSRLSEHYRVVYVEEPIHTDGPARLDRISQGPNLEVLVPHTPVPVAGFHDDQLPALEALLGTFLTEQGIDSPLVWFYTPMALPMLALMKPQAIVYDCMDELSAFLHAPRQLRQRESALLKMADLVLTGGPSLYESKRHLHANIHCLPSSVDAAHYAPDSLDFGSAQAHEADRLQSPIARPRLGFFGVIDERFDIELLRTMARARPHWQLMMVGPVVKIDPANLPRESNIHWLGMQPYERLPYLMAGWDVCLMPFALNESTRFISPTKTLEYMAGGKPVVSTAVGDVVSLYGDCVRIAAAGPAFIDACEDALTESAEMRTARIARMRAAVERSSWERAAATVRGLIEAAVEHAASIPASVEPAAMSGGTRGPAPLVLPEPVKRSATGT